MACVVVSLNPMLRNAMRRGTTWHRAEPIEGWRGVLWPAAQHRAEPLAAATHAAARHGSGRGSSSLSTAEHDQRLARDLHASSSAAMATPPRPAPAGVGDERSRTQSRRAWASATEAPRERTGVVGTGSCRWGTERRRSQRVTPARSRALASSHR